MPEVVAGLRIGELIRRVGLSETGAGEHAAQNFQYHGEAVALVGADDRAGEEIAAQGAAGRRFRRGGAVLRLGGDKRHVQHDRRAVTTGDGHREGVVAKCRGQPAPGWQADLQFCVGADESQEAFG